MKYHIIEIYKQEDIGKFSKIKSLKFSNINIAKLCFKFISNVYNETPINDIIKVNDYLIYLITDLPIIYFNVNEFGEKEYFSDDENKINNIINNLYKFDKYNYLAQYPLIFDDNYGSIFNSSES